MRVNASTLTAERVRGDIEVLSRAGLELEEFLSEAVASVGRAVPSVAVCIGTHDPATYMLTSARKYGDLHGQNDQDMAFGQLEYDSTEATSTDGTTGDTTTDTLQQQLPGAAGTSTVACTATVPAGRTLPAVTGLSAINAIATAANN